MLSAGKTSEPPFWCLCMSHGWLSGHVLREVADLLIDKSTWALNQGRRDPPGNFHTDSASTDVAKPRTRVDIEQ